MTFICRHSTLKVLDLNRDTPLGSPSFAVPSTRVSSFALPSLSTLRAPPAYILPFIQRFKFEYIPKLHTLNIKTAVGRFSHLHTTHQYREHILSPTFAYLSQLPTGRKFSLQLTAWSLTGLLECFVSSGLFTDQEEGVRRLSSIDQVTIAEASVQALDEQLLRKAVSCLAVTDGYSKIQNLEKTSLDPYCYNNIPQSFSSSKELQLKHILGFVCTGAEVYFSGL